VADYTEDILSTLFFNAAAPTAIHTFQNTKFIKARLPIQHTLLHPFLRLLNNTLQGIKIGHRTVKAKVVAYADDVTVFLTTAQDISILQEAIQQYEKESGVQINFRKSTAIPLGTVHGTRTTSY
jgi:hypothetical protein